MSETAEESVPVATATNGSGDAPATMMKNNKPQRETKRDETNIEELYDLTKPIPKVRFRCFCSL